MAAERKKDSPSYIIIAITIFILIAAVLLVYIVNFGSSLAKDIPSKDGVSLIKDSHAVFGQFGDYVGGILNPILTAINIFLLIKFSSRNIEFNNKTLNLIIKILN